MWNIKKKIQMSGASHLVVSDSLWSHRLWPTRGHGAPSVHGVLQARTLEWVAIPFSRGSSRPRDWTWVSCVKRQILYHLSHRRSPVSRQNDLQKQKQTQIQRHRKQLMVAKGKDGRKGKLEAWDQQIHTAIHKTDNQHGPTVWHRELCSISYNNLQWKRIWKRIHR